MNIYELERVQQSRRKELHNRFINKLLEHGNNINFEKISYKAWQKLFGKSIGAKAPGLFIELLRSKAESANGSIKEITTQTTRLSQTCVCGKIKKKALKERMHICECGTYIQRDLISALLANFVSKDGKELKFNKTKYKKEGYEQSLIIANKAIKDLSASSMRLLGLRKTELENLAIKIKI